MSIGSMRHGGGAALRQSGTAGRTTALRVSRGGMYQVCGRRAVLSGGRRGFACRAIAAHGEKPAQPQPLVALKSIHGGIERLWSVAY